MKILRLVPELSGIIQETFWDHVVDHVGPLGYNFPGFFKQFPSFFFFVLGFSGIILGLFSLGNHFGSILGLCCWSGFDKHKHLVEEKVLRARRHPKFVARDFAPGCRTPSDE